MMLGVMSDFGFPVTCQPGNIHNEMGEKIYNKNCWDVMYTLINGHLY